MSISSFSHLAILSILVPQITQANCIDTIPASKGIGTVYYLKDSKIKGYILGINDSSVSIIERKYWNLGLYGQQKSIPAEQIVRIEKKNRSGISALEGMGIGAVTGIIIGFAIGYSDCDDPDNDCNFFQSLFSSKSLKGALTLSIVLGGIGSIVGLFSGEKKKKKFHINGSRDAFISNKNEILYY